AYGPQTGSGATGRREIMPSSRGATQVEAENLAVKIQEKYLANLDVLPAKEKIHFLRRVYRLTADADVARKILTITEKSTIPTARRRARVLERIVHQGEAYPPVAFKPTKNARVRRRNEFFIQRPELQFFRPYS